MNTLIFQNKAEKPRQSGGSKQTFVHKRKINHYGENGVLVQLSRSRGLEQVCMWNIPDPTWVKLNFDGSMESGTREAGAEFLVRNDIGQPVAAEAFYLQVKDVNEVELCWVRENLTEQRIWVEGDSMFVITALKERNGFGGGCLMLDCRNMLRGAQVSRLSHIFREANDGADWLANFGRSAKEARVWTDNFAANLLDILHKDVTG